MFPTSNLQPPTSTDPEPDPDPGPGPGPGPEPEPEPDRTEPDQIGPLDPYQGQN
jgi:hypothetical protein